MHQKPLATPKRTLVIAMALSCAIAGTLSSRARAAHPADIPDMKSVPVEVLERAFWVCDHTATVNGVGATPVGACTAVFETLKEVKFGGDFGELLAWWRHNKPLEHTRLESR
jgi:hypothetical protein